jgi:hypothetical protein
MGNTLVNYTLVSPPDLVSAISIVTNRRRKGYGKDPQKGIKKIPHRREAVGYCLEKFGQFG